MKKLKITSIKMLCLISFLGFIACENSSDIEEELINSQSKGSSTSFVFDGDCEATSVNLIAGQNTIVGTVDVIVDGDNYLITYNVIEGWCLAETHLDVEVLPENFPMTRSGNPKNGRFEYSEKHGCASSFTYEVPTSEGTYIAAHAVVNCNPNEIEDFATSLPETLNACTTAKGTEASGSYFDLTVNDTWLAGDYGAWCVDQDTSLELECFDAAVYSSYEALPNGEFEQPENFDLVNWVLNQNFIGQDSGIDGAFTFGDVQRAIWDLVDDSNCVLCLYLGDWSEDRAQAIFDAAAANGEGYVPECGEMIAVILIPDNDLQSVIISTPLPCGEECEETAWGEGCSFPGNNWSMYFQYSNE